MAKIYNFIYTVVYAHDQTQIHHVCKTFVYIPFSKINVFGHVHYVYSDLMPIDFTPVFSGLFTTLTDWQMMQPLRLKVSRGYTK